MSDRPNFQSLDESASIMRLLAELDAPPDAEPPPPPPEPKAPDATRLVFAERAPKAEFPPPLPLPEAFTVPATRPAGRTAGATFAAMNWRNPAPPPPPVPEPEPPEPEIQTPEPELQAPEPECPLARWLHDEPPVLLKPVPAGRHRLTEFLTTVNWRNAAKPPALPERLQSLIPPPPKPGLFEDPDAEAGNRRGKQWSVSEVLGNFAFD